MNLESSAPLERILVIMFGSEELVPVPMERKHAMCILHETKHLVQLNGKHPACSFLPAIQTTD